MTKIAFRMAVLMAVVLPMLAAAQESYSDPTGTYVVDPKYPAATYPPGYVLNNKVPWETKVLIFDQARNYTSPEQSMVVTDEARLLNTSVRVDSSDGLRNMDQPQGIPEANHESVPPSTQFSPITNTTQSFTNSFDREERFGNAIFGGSYHMSAYIKATAATANAAKKLEASGEGSATGVAFHVEKQVVRGRAAIVGQNGGSTGGTAALYSMGQQVWAINLSGNFSPTPVNWSRSFFGVSKTFMVGPIPVTVTATLTGGIRMTVTGEVSPTVARLIVVAGGYVSVIAAGSVNVVLLSFGVTSNLSLFNISMPITTELSWPSCQLAWKLKADVQLTCLSGSVQAYASAHFLFFKKTWKLTIASWPGINRSRNLFDASGTESLGTC